MIVKLSDADLVNMVKDSMSFLRNGIGANANRIGNGLGLRKPGLIASGFQKFTGINPSIVQHKAVIGLNNGIGKLENNFAKLPQPVQTGMKRFGDFGLRLAEQLT